MKVLQQGHSSETVKMDHVLDVCLKYNHQIG